MSPIRKVIIGILSVVLALFFLSYSQIIAHGHPLISDEPVS